MRKKKWIFGCVTGTLFCLALCMLQGMFSAGSSYEKKVEAAPLFSDVKTTDWFFEDVAYVKNKKLMAGTGEMTFSPENPTTRGMLVTVLWRMEGEPKTERMIQFPDVAPEAYYYSAVAWATENKIVNGYNEVMFGPEDLITREQITTVLYRYATYKQYDLSAPENLDTYADCNEISDYAYTAFCWAKEKGIVSGTSDETLSPKGHAVRCQMAAMLRRFCEQFAETEKESMPTEETPKHVLEEGKEIAGTGEKGNNTTVEKEVDTEGNKTEDKQEAPENTLPTIQVGCETAKPGETVRIPVKVKNNPGILGMILTIGYDENILQLVHGENGEAVADVLTLTPSKVLQNGAKFVWDGLDLTPEDIKDGVILLLDFKIADTAEAGKYSINFGYAAGDIINTDLDSISPQLEQGYIMVEK